MYLEEQPGALFFIAQMSLPLTAEANQMAWSPTG